MAKTLNIQSASEILGYAPDKKTYLIKELITEAQVEDESLDLSFIKVKSAWDLGVSLGMTGVEAPTTNMSTDEQISKMDEICEWLDSHVVPEGYMSSWAEDCDTLTMIKCR